MSKLIRVFILIFSLFTISLSAQTIGGTRTAVGAIYPSMPKDYSWSLCSIPNPDTYSGAPLVVVYVVGDNFSNAAAKSFFSVGIKNINTSLATNDVIVIRNEEKLYLLIAVKNNDVLNSVLKNKDVQLGLAWFIDSLEKNDFYTDAGVVRAVKAIGKYTEKTGVFTYSRSGARCWTDNEAITLLNDAYSWYSGFFGYTPVDSIVVTDTDQSKSSSVPSSGVQQYTSWESRKVIITIKFKSGYGRFQSDREAAWHLFAHEVLHCWYYPRQDSDAYYSEALTQYLAQRFLLESGYISQASFDKRIQDYIEGKYNKGIPDYVIFLIHNYYQTDKTACIEFMKKAAEAFRKPGAIKTLFIATFGEDGKAK